MSSHEPSASQRTVTIDVTDDDVYAVLVNSLSEAADAADEGARRMREAENPSADWSENQERMAGIARALVESIETQIDAAASSSRGA